MFKFLTPKQKQVLEFIESYSASKGYAPTFDDIRKRFKFRSFGTVQDYLRILQEKGYLDKIPNQARAISLIKKQDTLDNLVSLPLLGMIAAGEPLEVYEHKETIDVPRQLISRKPCYVLQVRGNSMIEDHILNGDFIVVEEAKNADNGEVVVALVNHESATVKRFYREKNRVRLQPANSEMNPIYVKDVAIQGKVIGLFRKMR